MPISCHFRGCKAPLFSIVRGAISSELPFTFTFIDSAVWIQYTNMTRGTDRQTPDGSKDRAYAERRAIKKSNDSTFASSE